MTGNVLPFQPWWRGLWCMSDALPFTLDTTRLTMLEIVNKLMWCIGKLCEDQKLTAQEIEKVRQELQDAIADIKQYVDTQDQELRDLIMELTKGSLDYDVQHGNWIDTETAMRDMFNDVTVHAMTVKEFEEWAAGQGWTVATLSECGLNCRGWAVMNYWLVDPFELSDRYKPGGDVTSDVFDPIDLMKAKVDTSNYVYVDR